MKVRSSSMFKLEALVATGMPGAYKVLVFYAIQQIYSTAALGYIASWFSIAQLLGFFTAIGWGALIIVRVAKQESPEEKIRQFNSLFLMAIVTLIAVSQLGIIYGVVFDKLDAALNIIFLLVGWTLYQLPRHYLISIKNYRLAIIIDVLTVCSTIIILMLVKYNNSAIGMASAMVFFGAVAVIAIQGKVKKTWNLKSYEIKGLEFGLTNFLSGGIVLSLSPLAMYFEGPEFAGIISLFISISAISLLFPRAISIYHLPEISKIINQPCALKLKIVTIKLYINICNIVMLLGNILIGVLLIGGGSVKDLSFNESAAVVLIAVQYFFSTRALTGSNVLIAAEKSKSLLLVSVFTSSAYLLAVIMLGNLSIEFRFIILSGFLMVLMMLRNVVVDEISAKIYRTCLPC